MGIETTVVGSYPKPPPDGETFAVRKTLHQLERGEASLEALQRAQDDLARTIIEEQESSGIDIVTDGHARWDDVLTPFARNIAGFELGGLLRWFDNNVYYRKPVCVGPVAWQGASSVAAFRYAQSVAKGEVKAVVPGPVTFARLSVDEHYSDHERFALCLAQVLAQEAFELEAAGAGHIQIDEPALLGAPEDIDLARRCLGIVTAQLKTEVTLATYFGDAKRLGPEIFSLPVAWFALDFVSGSANWELVDALPDDKKLQAGLVDARNTKLEDEAALDGEVERLAAAVGEDRLRIAPSAGLEFLPRSKARDKLEHLAASAQRVGAR